MTTINLYQNQDEAQRKISARANGGFFFSLGILVLTLVAFFGIKIYVARLNDQNNALTDKINAQNKSLVGENTLQRILDMQNRITQIKNNLQIKGGQVGKLKMTDVLSHLGADVSPAAVISSYSYSDGKVKVSFTANNFNDIAQQILNFKKSTYFSNAVLGTVVRSEKNISADMTMDAPTN